MTGSITRHPPTLAPALAALALVVLTADLAHAQLPDLEICRGEVATLTAPSGYAQYRWTDLSTGVTSGRQTITPQPRSTRTFVLESRPALGPTLAVNGSFYSGDAGFESDYTPQVGAKPGTYFVAESPWRIRPGMDTCRDGDRDGAELRLVANADPTDRTVWRQRIAVRPGRTYSLSTTFWPSSETPVSLRFRVDGEWVGSAKRTGRAGCALDQIVEEYTVPAGVSAIDVGIAVVNTPAGTPIGIDGIVIAERFPTRFDTVVVNVVLPQPNDTTLIEACPGDLVTLADGTTVDSDAVVCRVASRSACGESYTCERVRFLTKDDVVVEVTDPGCPNASDGSIAVSLRGIGEPEVVRWADAPDVDEVSRVDLRAGAYAFEVVRGGDGCRVAATAVLTDPAALRWSTLELAMPPCAAGDFATVVAVGAGGTGELSVGFRQNGLPVDASGLLAGSVEAILTDDNGCTLETPLEVPPGAELDIAGPTVLEPGAAATFAAALDGVPREASWGFEPGGGDDIAPGAAAIASLGERWTTQLPGSGFVSASVALTEACTVRARRFVGVADWAERLFPTAFSPNGDGRNDAFDVVADPDAERLVELRVYDRWGALVYSSPDGRPWAGEAGGGEGRAVAEGVYIYSARVLLTTGREVAVRGEVGVFR